MIIHVHLNQGASLGTNNLCYNNVWLTGTLITQPI